jgi:hypothetical protein
MKIRLNAPWSLARALESRLILASAFLFLLVLLAGVSAAETLIFHSPGDNGLPAGGSPTVAAGAAQSVFLYINGGAVSSAPGTPCDTGSGSEVCGFDLQLTGLSGLTLTGFTADPGANLVSNLSAGEIRLNGLDSLAPTPGAKRIGELVVDAPIGGSLDLASGEVVGADLGIEVLSAQTVVTVSVPEPGMAGLLLSGAALLVLLERRRAEK